jgi:hypothetical protein
MFDLYFTRRLLEELTLADQAPDDEQRSVHLRACCYYRDLLTDARAAERQAVMIAAQLLKLAPWPVTANVCDLSVLGFRIDAPNGLSPGTCLALSLKGLAPLDAWVVWSDTRGTGCRFAAPLHPALIEAALAINASRQ